MTVSGRKNLNGKTGVESTRDRECQLWRVSAALDKASQAWPTKAHSGTAHHSKTRFLVHLPHIWLRLGKSHGKRIGRPPGRPATSLGVQSSGHGRGPRGGVGREPVSGTREGGLGYCGIWLTLLPSSHRLGLFMSPGKLAETRPDIKVPATVTSEEVACVWECRLWPAAGWICWPA